MSQFSFVLLNEGTSVSPLTLQVTPQWLASVAAATTVQLNRDVGPNWGGSASVRAGAGSTDVVKGEIVFALVDALPDAPGAIAYHDVDGNDVPVAFLALSTCNTLDDVSIAISHEVCETMGDATVNAWRDAGTGQEFAQELCDAVESTSYEIDGIRVSDFVLPAFFGPSAPGPYTYGASVGGPDVSGPFVTAPGGYQIVRSASNTTSQVHGAIVITPSISITIPFAAKKLERKRGWASRTYRRGVRL